MLGMTMVAVALATSLTTGAGASVVNYDGGKAAHIYSTDYYRSIEQPWVAADMAGTLDRLVGRDVQVCVRSAHRRPGVLTISSPRFVTGSVDVPHGRRMRTRCVTVTVQALTRPGRITVEEGTFVSTDTTWPVHGWVRSITIREEP